MDGLSCICRLFKKAVQQAAASEDPRRTRWGTLRGSERGENEAGGLFQQPAKRLFGPCRCGDSVCRPEYVLADRRSVPGLVGGWA
jgi:hypothetical protein